MSFLSLFQKSKLYQKNLTASAGGQNTPHIPAQNERGRTMLEVIMALLLLGMISVGGYAGVRYGLGLSQAWRAQAQVNQLAKDVMSLYAWQDSYATLSMRGTRGICNTIVTPGNQDCEITSPWNQKVSVSKGKSNASFKITLHETPKAICEHLKEMRFENVYMASTSCSDGLQDVEFVMDKDDRSCPEGCPSGYDCINGVCRPGDREDSCKNINCVGECLSGVCRAGTCLRKMNGSSCSIGVCYEGVCVEETTPEETTTEEDTTTGEETTPYPCNDNELYVYGTCYPCEQHDPIYAWDITELEGCSNRVTSCGTTGTMDCNSYLKACPAGYVETGNSYCQAGEIPINDGSNVYGGNTGCCREASKCEIKDVFGACYACSYSSSIDMGTSAKATTCVNTCAQTSTKRKAVGRFCLPADKCTDKNEPILSYESACYPCSYPAAIFMGDAAGAQECVNICATTDYPRIALENNCYLKSKCTGSNGILKPGGECMSCYNPNWVDYDTYEEAQKTCVEPCAPYRKWFIRGNPANGGYTCIPDKCSANQIQDLYGNCKACTVSESVLTGDEASAKACADKCTSLGTPRTALGPYCILATKECPPETPINDGNGNCYPCNHPSALYLGTVLAPECKKVCASSSTPRQSAKGYCGFCSGSTPIFGTFGSCFACDYAGSILMDSEEDVQKNCVDVCKNTNFQREISGTSCVLAGKVCADTTPVKDKSGSCYACDYSNVISYNSTEEAYELCANVCQNTAHPRYVVGTSCMSGTSLCDNKSVNLSFWPADGAAACALASQKCPHKSQWRIAAGNYCILCSSPEPTIVQDYMTACVQGCARIGYQRYVVERVCGLGNSICDDGADYINFASSTASTWATQSRQCADKSKWRFFHGTSAIYLCSYNGSVQTTNNNCVTQCASSGYPRKIVNGACVPAW